MSDITAYAWEERSAKQVCLSDSTSHIIELSVLAGHDWVSADLTTLIPPNPFLAQVGAGAPRTGYAWPGHGWKQVAYVTGDGHIHEIAVHVGGAWSQADLTQLAGAPPSVGANIVGYSWTARNSKQVAYVTADGHIHELYVIAGGKWQVADLTKKTKAPPADKGMIAAYAWDAMNMKQVVFRSADGHLHELQATSTTDWAAKDLTAAATPAPPVADLSGAVIGYVWDEGAMKQVVFTTADGHLHELSLSAGGPWKYENLSQQAQTPPNAFARSDVTAYSWRAKTIHSKQVAFSSSDGHIHELSKRLGGGWKYADLTLLTPGSVLNGGNLNGFEWRSAGSKQVVFETNSAAKGRHIHELSVREGGKWHYADLSVLTGSPS